MSQNPSAPATVFATPEETAAAQEAMTTEWSTWVAKTDIAYNGVVCYTAGDPVAVTNVERYKYDEQGLVGHPEDEDVQQIIRQIHEAAAPDQSVAVIPRISMAVPVLTEGE